MFPQRSLHPLAMVFNQLCTKAVTSTHTRMYNKVPMVLMRIAYNGISVYTALQNRQMTESLIKIVLLILRFKLDISTA